MLKLYRSTTDKKMAGICGGLGEILHVDPTIVRLVFVFVGIITGFAPLILTYIIGWMIIPNKPA